MRGGMRFYPIIGEVGARGRTRRDEGGTGREGRGDGAVEELFVLSQPRAEHSEADEGERNDLYLL